MFSCIRHHFHFDFRFNKEPFLRIVDILKPDFPTGRGAISPEKRVGLFLSYCASKDTQFKAGLMAGVKRTQTSVIIREVAMALVNRSRDFIKWPGQSEMRQLADENNEKFGIPDCPLGVDGKLNNGCLSLIYRAGRPICCKILLCFPMRVTRAYLGSR